VSAKLKLFYKLVKPGFRLLPDDYEINNNYIGKSGCRISLDEKSWSCDTFRHSLDNMRGAWIKLWLDYGKFTPSDHAGFKSRHGIVEFYRSKGDAIGGYINPIKAIGEK
jgi:hypothetical protein